MTGRRIQTGIYETYSNDARILNSAESRVESTKCLMLAGCLLPLACVIIAALTVPVTVISMITCAVGFAGCGLLIRRLFNKRNLIETQSKIFRCKRDMITLDFMKRYSDYVGSSDSGTVNDSTQIIMSSLLPKWFRSTDQYWSVIDALSPLDDGRDIDCRIIELVNELVDLPSVKPSSAIMNDLLSRIDFMLSAFAIDEERSAYTSDAANEKTKLISCRLDSIIEDGTHNAADRARLDDAIRNMGESSIANRRNDLSSSTVASKRGSGSIPANQVK